MEKNWKFQTIWRTLKNIEVINTDNWMKQIYCKCRVRCVMLHFNNSLADSSISILAITRRFDDAWFIKEMKLTGWISRYSL